MADKVMTAPLAVVMVNNVAIGKMRGIRVNENITRGRVQGLGQLVPDELPALSWAGTVQCDFYNIDFSLSQVPDAIFRNTTTVQQFQDSVTLQEGGVVLQIMKKVRLPNQPPSGLIGGQLINYATINGLFLNSEGFDINEAQISGRNQSFDYLFPIVYNTPSGGGGQ
jgi:hypothetical protein